MHISSQKRIYDVTVSVSLSRSFAAASKTVQSVSSKHACKTRSVSIIHLLTVLNTGLANKMFLPVGRYKMNQTVIRESQSCPWDRVILYASVIAV